MLRENPPRRARLFAPLSLLAVLAGCGARGNGNLTAADTGTPADTGSPTDTSTPVDASTPPVDVGSTPLDVATPPDDAGTPPMDVGTPPMDVGTPPVDAGAPPMDVGVPPVDAGVPPVDAGVTAGYVRTATSATLVEACTLPGAQRVLVDADDASTTLIAPFDLRFYGITVPQSLGLQVYSNGFISQTAEDPIMTFGGTIPSASRPNGVIAPYWVDLFTGADGVCAVVVGSAPIRRWIIQWKNASFYSGRSGAPRVGTASFELIYNESDGSMDFIYEALEGHPTGSAVTIAAVGVEHPNGVDAFVVCPGGRRGGVAPECTAVATGTRFRLAPTGG